MHQDGGAARALTTHEITYTSPGRCVFARVQNVALQVWFAQAQEEDARVLVGATKKMYEDYPHGISTLHWLRNDAPLPTPGARQHFSYLMDAYGHWFGESIMVLDGLGFWAGAVRAMLTGVRIASGGKAGFRVVPSLHEGLSRLTETHTERTGLRVQPAELSSALHAIIDTHG